MKVSVLQSAGKSMKDYPSIQAALDSIPLDNKDRVEIHLSKGTYRESVLIRPKSVSLVGSDPLQTRIVFNKSAKDLMSDGQPMRTFNSPTVFVLGDDFRAEGISFINDAGEGKIVGQAVALAVDADRCYIKNCRMLACQDTLFTGPLPSYPVEGRDFGGPSDLYPRKQSSQYYQDCYIEGDIDFIFGSATAYFLRCELFSRDRGERVNGFITAASSPKGTSLGYIFDQCRLTGSAGLGTVYLGRPWRDYARTLFIDCWMGDHIKSEGWDNWGKKAAEKTVLYAEYNSTGPGADSSHRVGWSHVSEASLENKNELFKQNPWISNCMEKGKKIN